MIIKKEKLPTDLNNNDIKKDNEENIKEVINKIFLFYTVFFYC